VRVSERVRVSKRESGWMRERERARGPPLCAPVCVRERASESMRVRVSERVRVSKRESGWMREREREVHQYVHLCERERVSEGMRVRE